MLRASSEKRELNFCLWRIANLLHFAQQIADLVIVESGHGCNFVEVVNQSGLAAPKRLEVHFPQ
jgi:hypothetical protein